MKIYNVLLFVKGGWMVDLVVCISLAQTVWYAKPLVYLIMSGRK